MAEEEVRIFLDNFPGEITSVQLTRIRELSKKRFGEDTWVAKDDLPLDDGIFITYVPKDGFLRMYVEYTQELEAPLEFHFFCAMAVMAQMVGRKQYIPRYPIIYPPTPLLLIAPSGICHKTVAANLALRLGRSVDLSVVANKVTPEDLARQLQQTHKGGTTMLFAPELSVFLGKQRYNQGLIEMLTDLLDCPDYWESGTIGRGKTVLRDVTLGMIGCSTPRWLKTSIPVEAFAGGFMSRLLMIVKDTTPRCFSKPGELDKGLYEKMRMWLQELVKIEQAVPLSKDAEKWYDRWYRQQRKELVKAGEDAVGYASRRTDHLLRLSLNLVVNRWGRVIEVEDLQMALKILSWIEDNTPAIIKSLMASDSGEAQASVILTLRRNGGHMPKAQLIKQLSKQMPSKLLMDAIHILLYTDQIGKYDSPKLGHVFFLKDWEE